MEAVYPDAIRPYHRLYGSGRNGDLFHGGRLQACNAEYLWPVDADYELCYVLRTVFICFGQKIWRCAHAGVGGGDPANSEFYLHGCRMNGITALPFLKKMLEYDNEADGFSVDWRPLATIWEAFDGTFATAIDLSNKTSKNWRVNMVPHRKMEHSVLGEALFAAWIAASCPEERIAASAMEQLAAYCKHVDWESVHLPYAFAAEGAMIYGNAK